MLLFMVPVIIPLLAVIMIAVGFIQWLIWSAQEEEKLNPRAITAAKELRGRNLRPIVSTTDLRSTISDN